MDRVDMTTAVHEAVADGQTVYLPGSPTYRPSPPATRLSVRDTGT
jgi:hypothetical protein